MKKMRRGVALLLAVLLVWTPAGTVRADEAPGTADANEQIEIRENKVSEDEAQANEAQAIQMQAAVGESAQVSTLVFGRETVVQDSKVVTSSGIGWNYDSSTNTLNITEDVTIDAKNVPKSIQSSGNLHIKVEEGKKLTVKNECTDQQPCGIYAEGNIVLDGKGTINIEHGSEPKGIYATKGGIKIQDITLNLLSGGTFAEIRANGGELVIEDAIVTAKGLCMAWNDGSSYYPVRILGRSVVDIESTNVSGGLRGETFEFSDQAHVKVRSSTKLICGANLVFTLAGGQTEDYYFRSTTDGNSFTKGNIDVKRASYFEYIGANHVDETTIKSDGEATHTMKCKCKNSTEIIAGCYGGTATCTAQAVCKVCGQSYGDFAEHQYNKYHVCSVCGGLDAGVVVAVDAGSEKRGYTSGEMGNAIGFAGEHPGAVLTIIDPKRECLDGLQVDNSQADFTIELDGKNNGYYGSVTVSSGKVTIRDSKGGGTFHYITTTGTGTVTLKSGRITSNVAVTGGTFNVNGGTISNIYLTDGQLNWNSSTAEGTNINYYRGQCKMTINAVPKSTLSILLPITQDLSRPVAVLGNGVSLTENMLAIKMGNSYMTPYTLKPVAQGNQIYARLSLTQLDAEDIVLKQVSGFTYNGKEYKPSVTVQRYVKPGPGTGMVKGDLTEGTDYTVTYKDNVNAGTATVTITGIGCYTDSVARTFTIDKAAPKQSVVDADSRTYSCRVDNADRVDLTAYLPKDHGAIETATATEDGVLTYSSAPSVAGGVLSYTIKSGEAASGVINVTVSTTNYEDIKIRIPVQTKDIGILKLMDGSAVTLQNATLTEGEKLSVLKFNDAVFVDEAGKEVPGTLVFRTPDAVPAVGTAEVEWVFRPKDADSYAEARGTVTVTVKEKTTSGGGSSGGTSSGGGGIGGGGAAVTDPKDDTKKDDAKKDNTKKDDTKQTAATPEPAGTKLKDSSGVSYEVTSDSKKTPTVAYTAAPKKAKKTITIPKTVTVDGTKYKVTSIEENAFAENKKVKQIVVSQNITTIGANAFADCPKLKVITIHSTKLTGKNVADDAFAGIADGTVIRVPKKMLDRYRKLFAKKGLSKKVKVVAIKNKNRKNK